jgi:hypothetical protein
MCFWAKDLPRLPPDETGIGDDVYLSNYYAVLGKEWFEKTRSWPVIKPAESIVYFEVTANYSEWEKQQTRTCIGVLSAYDNFFPGNSEFLEIFRQWAYTYNRNSLRREKPASFRQYFFYVIYIFLKMRIARKARRATHANVAVDWGTATSTKFFR